MIPLSQSLAHTTRIKHDELEGLLQATLHNIVQLLEVDGAICFLVRHGALELSTQYGVKLLNQGSYASFFELTHEIARTVLPEAKPRQLQGEALRQMAAADRPLVYQSLLWAPILPPIEIRLPTAGVIVLLKKAEHVFTPREQQLVIVMSQQLALTLDRSRLLEAERMAHAQAEALREVGNILSVNLELPTLFDALLDQMAQVVPYNSANLSLVSNGRAWVVRSRGYREDVSGTTFDISKTPTLRQLVHSHAPIHIADTQTNPDWQAGVHGAEHIRSWIGAPIWVDGQVVAILSADKMEPNYYQPTHLKMAAALANQAAVALRNAQLFTESQRQTQQIQAIQQLGRKLTGLTTVQEVCQETCSHICHALGYAAAVIHTVWRPDEPLHEHAAVGHTTWSQPLEVLTKHVLQTGQPVVQSGPNHAELCMPLLIRERALGVLSVAAEDAEQLNTADLDLFTTISDQLAIALEKTRFFEETDRQARELKTLFDLSAALRAAPTLDDILGIIITESVNVMNCAGSSVMLLEPDRQNLALRACYPPNEVAIGTRYTMGTGIVGHVAQTQKPYTAPDIFEDPLTHIPEQDKVRINAARSSLSVPLQTQDQLVGVLNVWFTEIYHFTHENEAIMLAMAEIAGSAIQRAIVVETLEQRVEARTRELEEANIQLQKLDVLKTRFVSEVSHELRTPIANLTLYIDLLKRSQGRPDKQARYMEVLEKQSARLRNLVEDVLYLSRLDLGKDKVQLAPLDLNEVLEEILQAQYERAEALGLELVYQATHHNTVGGNAWQGAKRPFQVLGERNQLAQMITHLLDNALNYTPHGHVHISLHMDGPKYLCLEIRDSGVGIPTEEWDDLFKRFYRGHNSSQLNLPGNGLGLAIADEIAKIHGGRIDLQSEVGVGSTFRVWLPMIRV